MRARVAAVSLLCSLVLLTLTTAVSPEPQRRAPTIGVLNYAAAHDVRVIQFLNALRDLGYVEGRNLAIIQRHADGVLDRLPELAAELVAAKVDLIIALGPAVWAAKQATTTIPIVIAFSGNPERQGVVASLARPGGNLTGFFVYVRRPSPDFSHYLGASGRRISESRCAAATLARFEERPDADRV